MKALTGIAVGALAVIGGIVALGISLKKKAENNYDYEEFDDIMDGDDNFDVFFDEDDENISSKQNAEDIAEAAEDIKDEASEIIEEAKD